MKNRNPNGTYAKATPTNELVKKQKSVIEAISERQIFRMQEDLQRLKVALDEAENLATFNREDLHRIYREVIKDPHLQSQWGTRKLKTLSKKFELKNEAGEPDEAATQLLETEWFLDLMDEILEAKLWGFRLIELGPFVNNKPVAYRTSSGRIYDPVNVINPDHVKPEFGVIVQDPGIITGLAFDDPSFKNLIFAGRRHNLGIMLSAVKYILFKNNCVENWSEWSEVFGMDIRVGKTEAEGEAKKKFLQSLKTMGSSGYGVIDKEDEIEYFGTTRTDAYKVYDELMNAVDKNVSKLVFGQDVVSNNTGHVIGKVGENVSNLYGEADARRLQLFINDTVLPKLIGMGLSGIEGRRFEWNTTEQLTLEQHSNIDLKISQMGYKPAKKFLEDKYNVQLEELPEPAPAGAKPAPGKGPVKLKVAAALKELYADAVE